MHTHKAYPNTYVTFLKEEPINLVKGPRNKYPLLTIYGPYAVKTEPRSRAKVMPACAKHIFADPTGYVYTVCEYTFLVVSKLVVTCDKVISLCLRER